MKFFCDYLILIKNILDKFNNLLFFLRKIMKILISFLGLLVILTSCISAPKIKGDENYKNEYIFISSDDSLYFYAIINKILPIGDKALKIDKVTAEFSGKNQGNIIKKTEVMESIFQGNYPISQSERMYTNVFVKGFSQKRTDSISINLLAATNQGKFQKTLPKTHLNFAQILSNNQFLKLIPAIDEIDQNTLKFRALAIRQAPNSGDYLPSSENFKVNIINNKDGNRWSSSDGQMFMQMIGEVLPNFVGSYSIFEYEYKIEQKKFRLNGMNDVEFIVPAKSNPAKISIKYWKK
jgi:hypothetical protein